MIYTKSHLLWETPSPLHGSRVFRLPAWLPDPCYIVRTELNLQGTKFPAGMDAISMIAADIGGRYTAALGFPKDDGNNTARVSNPISHREWTRLLTVEIGESLKREWAQESPNPVRVSRSEGDLIALDIVNYAGSIPVVWTCPRFSYLAGYEGWTPPATFAWALGTHNVYPSKWPWPWNTDGTLCFTGNWGPNTSYNPDAVGRSVGGSYGQHFAQRFTAPAAGTLSSATFRIRTLYAAGVVTAQLYSDNNGSPGSPIGNASWPVNANYAWDIELAFPIGCGAVMAANTPYWVVFSSPTLSASLDTCNAVAPFLSGRGGSVAGITNNLPNGETFLMQFSAIA